MKLSRVFPCAVLATLAALGVQAEPYHGVLTVDSQHSRAEVAVQGPIAARLGNEYSDAAFSGSPPVTSTVDRATVRAEAVAKAHDPLASLDRRAFYRDEVPKAYKRSHVEFTRQAGR